MKKARKEFIEWGIMLLIVGVLYFTGWHTIVISSLQGWFLETGLITPSELKEERNLIIDEDFLLKNGQGELISFEAFRGQVVFINFWATWCPPCLAEMPDIHDLYLKKKDQVQFMMISVDENKEKALEFIGNKAYTFPVYFPASSLPSALSSKAIPTSFLVDKNGAIVMKHEGMAQYDTEKFRALLDRLSSEH